MEGTFENQLNVQLFYDTLAQILGEQYGVKITVTVKPKTKEGTHDVGEVKEKMAQAV